VNEKVAQPGKRIFSANIINELPPAGAGEELLFNSIRIS
jgi:hypothetical protein